MQRDRWKLSDILDRRVPGQAVVQVGNDAHVDTDAACLFDKRDHGTLVGGHGKKDLIDKQCPGQMQAVLHVADDVGFAGLDLRIGQRDKALEAKAEITQRLKMVAESLADAAGADDQHIARVDTLAIAAVDQGAPQCTARAEHGTGQQDRQDNHDARNRLAARQVNGAAQDQTANQRGLQGHAVFMQAAAVLNGPI